MRRWDLGRLCGRPVGRASRWGNYADETHTKNTADFAEANLLTHRGAFCSQQKQGGRIPHRAQTRRRLPDPNLREPLFQNQAAYTVRRLGEAALFTPRGDSGRR